MILDGIIILCCVIGGLAALAEAFLGDDNIDHPEWFDSWF